MRTFVPRGLKLQEFVVAATFALAMVKPLPKPVRKHRQHACTCCGGKRRIENCRLPGAREIIRLRKTIASRKGAVPQASWKMKLPVKKYNSSSKQKKEVQKLYGASSASSWRRTQYAGKTSASSLLDTLQPSAEDSDALKELVAMGFIKGHRGKCPSCGGSLSPPEQYQYEGHLYVRCCNWKWRFNVTFFSIFQGTRLNLPLLLKLVIFYCRSNRFKRPRVRDAMTQLKLGRTQAQCVY